MAVLRKLALLAASACLLTVSLVSAVIFSFVYKPDWKPRLKQVVNRGWLFRSSQLWGVSKELGYVKL